MFLACEPGAVKPEPSAAEHSQGGRGGHRPPGNQGGYQRWRGLAPQGEGGGPLPPGNQGGNQRLTRLAPLCNRSSLAPPCRRPSLPELFARFCACTVKIYIV